jgi:hypothetical protein
MGFSLQADLTKKVLKQSAEIAFKAAKKLQANMWKNQSNSRQQKLYSLTQNNGKSQRRKHRFEHKPKQPARAPVD